MEKTKFKLKTRCDNCKNLPTLQQFDIIAVTTKKLFKTLVKQGNSLKQGFGHKIDEAKTISQLNRSQFDNSAAIM